MSVNPSIETEEDIQIIKDYTLLPILLDMLARDMDTLKMYQDKIVFRHVIFFILGKLKIPFIQNCRALKVR